MELTTLRTSQDWKGIIGEQFGVVIDPMVCRTAEMYILGAKEATKQSDIKDKDILWWAISQNIGALQAFIDSLILRKRLPLIGYWLSFGNREHLSTPASIKLRDRCNQKEEILRAVQLDQEAYFPLKRTAIETMNQKRPRLTKRLKKLILPELSAFDFSWSPDLGELKGFKDSSVEDKRLLTFLFRGILFGAYAQAAEADEVVQPKLARLHILSSLRQDDHRKELQNDLFAGLERIAKEGEGREEIQDLVDLTWMPTFLPYLLSKDPKSPQDLFDQAIKLRGDAAVRAYAAWFDEIKKDMEYHRRPTEYREKELKKIQGSLVKQLEVQNEEPIKIKASLAVVAKATGPEVKGEVSLEDVKIYPAKVWGWFTNLFPGHRYRKLLMDLVIGQRRYLDLDSQLKSLWTRT